MDSTLILILATLVFIGIHVLPSTPLRAAAVRAVGERAYQGLFSLASLAALVWMMPSAEGTEIFVITLITYLIALGGFTHVIAGSAEAFYLLFTGHESLLHVVFGFFLPTLAGNVAGGTVLSIAAAITPDGTTIAGMSDAGGAATQWCRWVGGGAIEALAQDGEQTGKLREDQDLVPLVDHLIELR